MQGVRVIFEDEDVLVVCKKAGVVVTRAETVQEKTIQDWMEDRLGIKRVEVKGRHWREVSLEEYFRVRVGVVHRLDRETTGVMVLAKKVESFGALLDAFKWRRVEKRYLALTHGLWRQKRGVIRLPLGRARWDNKRMEVQTHGRLAETEYAVWDEFRSWELPDEVDETVYRGFSLVEFRPRTGRTHQLRVHAKHAGHPIVADYVYLDKQILREDRKWVSHTLLYAYSLRFKHPRTGKEMEFKCELDELKEILRKVFGYSLVLG